MFCLLFYYTTSPKSKRNLMHEGTVGSGVPAYNQLDSAFDGEPQFHFINVFILLRFHIFLNRKKLTTCFGSGCDSTHEHFPIHYFSFDQLCLSSPNLCLTDECVSIMNVGECRNLCMWQSSKWRRKTVGRVPGYSFYCSALGICLIVPNKLKQNGQADTIRYILICISMTFPMPE